MSDFNQPTETTSLSLQNLDNYNSIYSHSINEVYKIFTMIIINFIENAKKSIYIKDQSYMNYVMQNGISILHTVFSMIYLYSKNLEMSKQYTEKGYYIYCEFIGKVGDNNHKFLNLNSKDATLFVLKKTIYEINNNYKRNFTLSRTETDYINRLEGSISSFINIIMTLLSINKLININNEECNYIRKNKNIVVFPLSILESIKHFVINNTVNKSNLTTLENIINNNENEDEKLKQIYTILRINHTETDYKIYDERTQEKIFKTICEFIIQ